MHGDVRRGIPARAPAGAVVAALIVAVALLAPTSAAARQGADEPSVDAEAWTLVDAETGAVIASEDAGERRPIASTTKLMTALLTLERADLGDVHAAPGYEAAPVESQIGLATGERMSVDDLLAALLLESANDAAVTLATGVAGSQRRFVAAMNARARRLGLEDTSYENPIGFDDPDNHSTAADLATLTRLLMQDRRFRAIVDDERARLETGARPRVVENRNELVGSVPHVDGVKTGHTLDAGYVLVGSAERDGARVVSVVLGTASEAARDRATRKLLEHGLDSYAERPVLREERALAQAAVTGSDGAPVALAPRRDLSLTLLRGEQVGRRVQAPAELTGPLPAGARVGSVAVVRAGEVVDRVPLVTAAAVPEPPGLADTLADLGERPVLVAGVTFAIACAVALAVIGVRRRRTGPRQRVAA